MSKERLDQSLPPEITSGAVSRDLPPAVGIAALWASEVTIPERPQADPETMLTNTVDGRVEEAETLVPRSEYL